MLGKTSFKAEFALILDGLRNDKTIYTTLDLSHRGLDKAAAEELGQALATNHTLVDLNLSHNLLGDEGSASSFFLFSFLANKQQCADKGKREWDGGRGWSVPPPRSTNNPPRPLTPPPQGAQAIAKLIGQNRSLRLLDLSFNKITRRGVQAIVNSLKNNVYITSLALEEVASLFLCFAFQRSPPGLNSLVLQEIDIGILEGNLDPVSPQMRKELNRILELNKKFQMVLGRMDERMMKKNLTPHLSLFRVM